MKSKDQQLLEEAYNKIQSKQLQEDAGEALRSYSNAGDNVLGQLADMFSTALGLVGKSFGASSSGNSQGSALTLQQAKDIRAKIAQVIEGKQSISFYSGGVYHDAKPELKTFLAKLDANIQQAEEAAKSYNQAGFFGRLFKSSGKNVAKVKTTDAERYALDRAGREIE
jgi:hypothetical protein